MNTEARDFQIVKDLIRAKVIKRYRNCNTCNGELQLKHRNSHSGNKLITWRCRKCQRYNSVADGSFFSLFRKPMQVILQLLKLWSLGIIIQRAIDKISIFLSTILSLDSKGQKYYLYFKSNK